MKLDAKMAWIVRVALLLSIAIVDAQASLRKMSAAVVTVIAIGSISTFLTPSVLHLDGRMSLVLKQVSLVSKQSADFLDQEEPEARTTLRGCLVHWYGDLNYAAMEAWIKYHRERWGLTDVDIFLPDRRLTEARDVFGNIYDGVKVNLFNNTLREDEAAANKGLLISRQFWAFNEALQNARAENNDYFINFDADEFLISDDFPTLPSMFAFANRSAVSVPMFGNQYHRCSNNNLTFGSTTFHAIRAHGSSFVNDSTLEYYTDPPRGCSGNTKYIVIPEFFHELKSPHDPLGCTSHASTYGPPFSVTTYYMSGRKVDGEHVRFTHMRTGVGIFADMTMSACQAVRPCHALNGFGSCAKTPEEATTVNKPNSMNVILHDFPLYTGAFQHMEDAVCYAKRYPALFEKHCLGDPSLCVYGALSRHYQDKGKAEGLIWGCSYRNSTRANW